MKKLLVFLLCMLMAVSVFGALSVSAEEASIPAETIAGLVEFKGYSVRTNDYNGIRAEFDLDKAKLAELEETYNVKIDMLFGKAGAEAPDSLAKYEALQLDNAGATSTFYDSKNGTYLGKIYSEEDGKAKFFYTVTFKNASETKDNLNADLYFRLVVTLTDKSDETVTATIPVDCKSPSFNYAVSLREVAKKLVDLSQFDNSFVRRAISIANGSYKADAEEAVLLGKALSDYSIVIKSTHATYNETLDLSAARALAAAFEEELGVGLPIRYNTPDNEAAYITIDTTATFDDKYEYEITAEGSVITVKANTVPAAAAGCEALAEAIASGYNGEAISGSIYGFNYDSLYVSDDLLYQIDFFNAKASFGKLVGGTFGNTNYYKFSTAAGYTDHYSRSNFIVAGEGNANSKKYFDDYIVGTPDVKPYGPVMQILTPWYAKVSKTGVVYTGDHDQYTDGNTTLRTFQSLYGDGYLELGFDTEFNTGVFKDLFKAKLNEAGTAYEGGKFTYQVVASFGDSYYYDENGVYTKMPFQASSAEMMMFGMARVQVTNTAGENDNIVFSGASWHSTFKDYVSGIGFYVNGGEIKIDKTKMPPTRMTVQRSRININEFNIAMQGYYSGLTSNQSIIDLGEGNYDNTAVFLGVNTADYYANGNTNTSISNYSETYIKDSNGNNFPGIESNTTFSIGSNANTKLYALRIYKDVLTGDEVIRNHFADVAKYFKLNLTGFDINDAKFTVDEKKAIFALASGITLDSSVEAVEALQTAVAAKIAEYSAN